MCCEDYSGDVNIYTFTWIGPTHYLDQACTLPGSGLHITWIRPTHYLDQGLHITWIRPAHYLDQAYTLPGSGLHITCPRSSECPFCGTVVRCVMGITVCDVHIMVSDRLTHYLDQAYTLPGSGLHITWIRPAHYLDQAYTLPGSGLHITWIRPTHYLDQACTLPGSGLHITWTRSSDRRSCGTACRAC